MAGSGYRRALVMLLAMVSVCSFATLAALGQAKGDPPEKPRSTTRYFVTVYEDHSTPDNPNARSSPAVFAGESETLPVVTSSDDGNYYIVSWKIKKRKLVPSADGNRTVENIEKVFLESNAKPTVDRMAPGNDRITDLSALPPAIN